MKIKFPKPFFILLASAVVSSADAATLTGLLDLSGRDVPGLGLGSGESNTNFASPKQFSATTDNSLSGVAWSDGGFSGVVDVSFDVSTTGTPTATLTSTPIKRGGKGAFGIDSDSGNTGLLGTDEGTLTFANLQFTYVSGDTLSNIASIQFAAIYFGNNQVDEASETATINGITISNSDAGGDTTAAMRNDFAHADSFVLAATAGQFSINGIDVAVTAVPEPSTALLSGLAGLALLARRRRS